MQNYQQDYEWEEEETYKGQIQSKPTNQKEQYSNDFQDQEENNKIHLPKLDNNKITPPKKQQKNSHQLEPKNQQITDILPKKLAERSKNKQNMNKSLEKNNSSICKNNKSFLQVQKRNSQNDEPNDSSQNLEQSRGIGEYRQPKQSKYMGYLKTQFPFQKEQLQKFPQQKLDRLNQKLKIYIGKVNDELTEMINQNLRILKNTTSKKQQKTVEDEIRVLQEQLKTSQVYAETIEKELKNLTDTNDKLEQERQLSMDEEISQLKTQIKTEAKDIHDIKLNVHHQGNKLAAETNWQEKMKEVKQNLLKTRIDEEKTSQKIKKQEENFQDLTEKNSYVDQQLQQLMEQVKTKNIKINSSKNDKKLIQKHNQLKQKLQNLKTHKDKVNSLSQTKAGIVSRDIEILKGESDGFQQKTNIIDIEIKNIQQKSKQVIDSVRNSPVLQAHILAHLDFIYKNIQEGTLMNRTGSKFNNTDSKEGKSRVNSKNARYQIKKSASVANVQNMVRSQSQSKSSFNIQKKTPFQLKPKQKIMLKISQQKGQKRIWRDKQPADQTRKSRTITEAQSNVAIKKPFELKKNSHHVQPSQSHTNLQVKTPLDTAQKQNQKATLLGPKMMKFKKHQNSSTNNEPTISKSLTQKNPNEKTINLTQNQEKTKQKQQNQVTHAPSKPKFKLKKAQKQKLQIPKNDLYPFSTETPNQQKNFRQSQKQVKQSGQNEQIQNPGINFGRRQIQRKIKRKQEDSYVI